MIGIVIAVVLAILLIGALLKLIKFAVLIALGVGIYMLARDKFGAKRIR